MDRGIHFDWDAANTRHLERHRVTRDDFETLICGDPVYLEYDMPTDEERYKVLGATRDGRILIACGLLGGAGSERLPHTQLIASTKDFTRRIADETNHSYFQIRIRRGCMVV